MAFAAAIPLIASAIPLIAGMFKKGSEDSDKGSAGNKGAIGAPPLMPAPETMALATELARQTQSRPTIATTPSGNIVLPPDQSQALNQIALNQQLQPTVRDQTAQIRAALQPDLAAIRQQQEHRANQIRATSEHRELVARQRWERMVARKLSLIQRQTAAGGWRRY